MKKVKLKANAKINLTLDVKQGDGGYHDIKSLVTTVNLYDEITITKRDDLAINLVMDGLPVDCDLTKNNAYLAASLFTKTFKTNGVDIYIKKNIPIGGGLGGSAADIAGVLNGMKRLLKPDVDIMPLANRLGSDSGYMTVGGWAVIEGRGEKITTLDVDKVLDILIISGEASVSTKACYNGFDQLGKAPVSVTAKAVDALKNGDDESFYAYLKNDLYEPATKLASGISEGISSLLEVGAQTALMTGSGSAVYGIFEGSSSLNKAYRKLKGKYGDRLIKARTVNREEL